MAEFDPRATQRGATGDLAAELEVEGFTDSRVVGRGGFGTVYRFDQRSLHREVALKVLQSDIDRDNRERFLREQRAASYGRAVWAPQYRRYPSDWRHYAGRPYLVMQFHELGSLDALCAVTDLSTGIVRSVSGSGLQGPLSRAPDRHPSSGYQALVRPGLAWCARRPILVYVVLMLPFAPILHALGRHLGEGAGQQPAEKRPSEQIHSVPPRAQSSDAENGTEQITSQAFEALAIRRLLDEDTAEQAATAGSRAAALVQAVALQNRPRALMQARLLLIACLEGVARHASRCNDG